MTNTIEIHDVGPIDHLSIPLPEGGGVVIFRGRNGSGKSTAITAVDELARGGALSARARHGKATGSVEGLGVRVSVGKVKATRRGQLEVESFEPRVDVAKLVDPGIKDDEIADRYRIATACSLAEITPDATQFRAIADIAWSPDTFDGSADLITMASRVRRDLNAAALAEEKAAEKLTAEAEAVLRDVQATKDAPSVADAQAALERAIAENSRIESERKAAAAAKERIERARAVLAKVSETDAAPSQVARIEAQIVDMESVRDGLRRQLAEVERDIVESHRERDSETARVRAVREAIESREAAQRAIDEASAVGDGPTDADAEAATTAVRECRARIAVAAQAERDAERITQANHKRAVANATSARSTRLREAAARTDDVLSAHLASVMPQGLRVQDGRLVADRGGRVVPFGELSEGERWRIALDIAIDAMGETGIVAIEQAAWEGLDGDARRAINAHVKQRGVYLFTAEADHDQVGPLRAEEFAAKA